MSTHLCLRLSLLGSVPPWKGSRPRRLGAALAIGASLCGAQPPADLQKQLQEALKQLQEMQGQGLPAPFGNVNQPWNYLQQQCTSLDKQNPRFACLPVKMTVADDVMSETWAQEPSGLLPNTKPFYCTFKSQLSYTAEGKGKLLHTKDFSEFHLLVDGTPETTNLQRSYKWVQGYHFEGPNATPVFYHDDLMNTGVQVWKPFRFAISYPGLKQYPREQATKNYTLEPLHAVPVKDPSGTDLWGSQLPNEYIEEQEVTPAVMKAFVAARGFEKTYSWKIEPVRGREWETHRLSFRVEIGDPCPEKIQLVIRTRDGLDRYVFSEASPGKLEFTLEAEVTPAALADEVSWELPELPGATRQTIPADGKGKTLRVIYTQLPQSNASFGPQTIRASVRKDRCQAEAQRALRFFFPAFAKNNPGGDPNWFHYWKQTSAGQGPARFGGGTGKCAIGAHSHDLGYYRHEIFDTVYYVCDLRNLGDDFTFLAKQLEGSRMKDAKVAGIDTFAVTCRHENAHLTHFTQWWKPYRTSDRFLDTNHNGILDDKEEALDKDKDLVPDVLEAGLGLDPHNPNTYGIGPDGDDEEFLCWMAEAGWKIGGADQEDWAKPGKQWK
jgi:hypothetical protein